MVYAILEQSNMNIQEFKQEFDKHLFLFVDKKLAEYKKISKNKEIKSIFSHVKTYIQGGKRLRPYGAYLGFVESGKKLTSKEWSVFVALELIHVLALIHDDIMDKAHDRRGIETIHTHIARTVDIVRGDKVHFSNSQAILVGDIIFASAFQILRQSGASMEIQEKIHQLLDEVIIGQMIDVRLAHVGIATRDEIMTKSKYKTALYTFARPFELGAMLGGLSSKKLKEFVQIGEILGLTYQTQDDYLDIFGSKDILQKELLNDIREGQQTLVTHHFFQSATLEQKQIFEKYFGTSFSSQAKKQIVILLQESGAQEKSLRDLQNYFKKTRKELYESSLSKKTKENIEHLIVLLEKRN